MTSYVADVRRSSFVTPSRRHSVQGCQVYTGLPQVVSHTRWSATTQLAGRAQDKVNDDPTCEIRKMSN